MFGNAGHRLFVFDCCSPKIAGAYIASAIWSRSVPHGQSPTGPYPAVPRTLRSPDRYGFGRISSSNVPVPVPRHGCTSCGRPFTFPKFTRSLHDLYTKLLPDASNQGSHYFQNLEQSRRQDTNAAISSESDSRHLVWSSRSGIDCWAPKHPSSPP